MAWKHCRLALRLVPPITGGGAPVWKKAHKRGKCQIILSSGNQFRQDKREAPATLLDGAPQRPLVALKLRMHHVNKSVRKTHILRRRAVKSEGRGA